MPSSYWYPEAIRGMMAGEIDLVNDDLRLILVMTLTTADTEVTANVIDDFTTLDEFDGANYARQTFAGKTLSEDQRPSPDGRHQVSWTGDSLSIANLGSGTRTIKGAIMYQHVTNDADSVPIGFHEIAIGAVDPDGSDLTVIVREAAGIAEGSA